MRLRHHIHHAKRAGLTLVEMLIALALSIFIMAILSEAFVKGLEVFGQYKALADLEQRLRTVANIVRRDLRAQHFDGGRKLSECTASGKPMPMLDGLRAGNPPPILTNPRGWYTPDEANILLRQLQQYRFKSPSEGFFSIEEWANRPAIVGPPPVPARGTMVFEGQDSSARPSFRDQMSFDTGNPNLLSGSSDVLHFTSRLEGNEPDKFFYGKVAAGSILDNAGHAASRYDNNAQLYTSQAAELLYFLHTDDTVNLPGVGTTNGPVLTFNLYRQAWLLVPSQFSSGPLLNMFEPFPSESAYRLFSDVSAFFSGGNANYNTMADVQHRDRRVDAGFIRYPRSIVTHSIRNPLPAPQLANVSRDGSDILLTNVISFDVKVFDPFAYKVPLNTASGRGAYVDIGDTVRTAVGGINPFPTAAALNGDSLVPIFGGVENDTSVVDFFDTGTSRFEGTPGPVPGNLSPLQTPATHRFPFTSIQITIRVYEPKSRQTRQITIIQDM